MKVLILSTAEAYRCEILHLAKIRGHQVRVQKESDGPAETRSKVRWADLIVAAGSLRENAVGALYLAYDQKKKVMTVEMHSPGWVTAYWGNRSFAEWAGTLPTLDEQQELFP